MKKEYRKIRAASLVKRLLNTNFEDDIRINIQYQEVCQKGFQLSLDVQDKGI